MGIKHAYGGGFIVMPRSRSMSMESKSCSSMSRLETVSVKLHQPVRKGGFAVINMRNDAKIPD